ncbi:hypothetical protein, variant [Aphanomyces invadans]|uniref:SRP54-type proteins GTP-binding domain-containing protein n=1 Tax=Aphanomyces invadans TaxID=157072 RepID=A0A024U7I2_9STRA|nr:hypothetical protein, variant [Aphanomyces invadans]ETW02229.1 hypothetical protein, variant [Aphanomyces invadans]|eukprot:XP_008868834.1 hypothetical protein, variant [Aphanomyces invadans]
MLDHVSIFSQSGTVLWSRSMCKLRGNPVDHLVKTVLLEERLGRKEFNYESYQMRWSLENKLQLVLVVVYQKVLQLLYVDELLERLKREVVAHFADDIRTRKAFASFDKTFDRILRDVESGHLKTKRPITAHAPAVVSSTEIDLTRSAQDDGNGDGELEKLKHDLKLVGSSGSKQPRTMRTGPRAGKKKGSKKDAEESTQPKGGKARTVWHDPRKTVSSKEMAELDRSRSLNSEEEEASLAQRRNELIGEGGVDDGDESDDEQSDTSNVSGSDSDAGATGWSFGKTRFGDFLQSISGNKILDREDVAPIVEQFRQQLISKNVATEVAQELCESVISTMVGQRLESFTRIQTVVQKALEAALLRILTPKKSTDVLREVLAARDQGRCFSIVFVGVNGVGKSTSLSKVCYYLKSRGVKIMIAACDTFRSGAVEQLNQHCKVLDVPLFERGYAKDPASVAKDAIAYGNDNGFDCVLIDTAGRMQNNEPLMRALAKLVSVNNPDLVLFVGEALVGNDGIDQLSLFDRVCLVPRVIKMGEVLTSECAGAGRLLGPPSAASCRRHRHYEI